MGLASWAMHRAMKKEAVNIANKVAEKFSPNDFDDFNDTMRKKLFYAFFNKELSSFSEAAQKRFMAKSLSLEGFCYLMGLDFGLLKNTMVLRCLEFTQMMDAELYTRGFPKQTEDIKRKVFHEHHLDVGDWEKFL